MFCYQCEQTAKGKGCYQIGVCGKTPAASDLQDLLIGVLKGLSQVAQAGRVVDCVDPEVGPFLCEAMFSTLTNVSFDPERIAALVKEAVGHREVLAAKVVQFGGKLPQSGPATYAIPSNSDEMLADAKAYALTAAADPNPDIESLKQTLIYGIKGVAAYADHARILGQEDDAVYAFIERALAATLRMDLGLEEAVGLVLDCGKINIRAMELLDAANTGAYGHPVPTPVPLGHKQGKAILISGHDLKDLAMLLEQTKDKDITIYTHGEMLPCHGYPELKKYPHFYGHYGTAWQNQKKEFAAFPGAILMTTNCIQDPKAYPENIFTTGLVSWPGIRHIGNGSGGSKDFTPVIERAQSLPGFTTDQDNGRVLVGFGRNAVLGVAGKVIEAVKSGAIRHFFLVAGCDGAKPGRNYYTEFVEKVPQDCVVLTLACGKFRFFDKDLGDIGGIPRLLDIGQCNDAYSAVKIALALAEAFDCGVNDLPLSLVLSWYEQKAVAILLSLLALGVRDIRLGPSLPAFITPNVVSFLVENYAIKAISTPDEDLKAILG